MHIDTFFGQISRTGQSVYTLLSLRKRAARLTSGKDCGQLCSHWQFVREPALGQEDKRGPH